MIEQDTIKLLRECDAGVKMGVTSIDEVIGHAQSDGLRHRLNQCRSEHQKLGTELQELLGKYGDQGKNPNPIAKGMSWAKTNMKLSMEDGDKTIADLMVDGCNMGVKSLTRYLNQYQAADEKSKDLAKRLIKAEEQLGTDLRRYL
jgi:hypothetical protein